MDDSAGRHPPERKGDAAPHRPQQPQGADPRAAPSPASRRRTQLPSEPLEGGEFLPPSEPRPQRSEPAVWDESHRPSVLDVLTQSRTTLFEVGKAARRLSSVALGLANARSVVRQLVLSFALGLILVLTVALLFAGGTLRLVLGILVGTCLTSVGVFVVLWGVSKLASRYGARSLPGSPWLWLSGVLAVAVAGTLAVTMSIWEVTKVARASRLAQVSNSTAMALPAPAGRSGRADAKLKRDKRIGLERGVLYAPPGFESPDGQFDLIVHYHGNANLVEQSVAYAEVNALVAILNFGDGSGQYSKPLSNPYAFDRMLTVIEARAEKQLGLERPQIRRIALSAWSAGFASVNQILKSRSRFDRIDAVLLLDTPHAQYAPMSESEVYRPSIEPYVKFGQRALDGRKLMVITHSAIQTEGYPSTTRTTDALLADLGLERRAVSPDRASPPPVDIPEAVRAFPSGERNWLEVVSRAEQGSFHVYECTGQGKGDHIAHLAQMSVTALPLLRERWREPPP